MKARDCLDEFPCITLERREYGDKPVGETPSLTVKLESVENVFIIVILFVLIFIVWYSYF